MAVELVKKKEDRHSLREDLARAERKIEDLTAERDDARNLHQLELEQKQQEVTNLDDLLRREKLKYQQDPKETLLAAIREQQRAVEEKK